MVQQDASLLPLPIPAQQRPDISGVCRTLVSPGWPGPLASCSWRLAFSQEGQCPPFTAGSACGSQSFWACAHLCLPPAHPALKHSTLGSAPTSSPSRHGSASLVFPILSACALGEGASPTHSPASWVLWTACSLCTPVPHLPRRTPQRGWPQARSAGEASVPTQMHACIYLSSYY